METMQTPIYFFILFLRLMYQMILKNQQSVANLTKETSAFKKGLKSVKQALSKRKSAPHKTRSTPERVTIEIKDFDASVFERLMRYIHCGVVAVDPRTVIGKGCMRVSDV